MSNPQPILGAPRFFVSLTKETQSDTNNAPSSCASIVYLKNSLTNELVNEPESIGYLCRFLGIHRVGAFGRGQIIFSKIGSHSGKRVLSGGSEPRVDGQAISW
ncbi:hypothetical protein K501DRAFT_283362 [Backusella circina FSU 941]|nr:hypothetical protein K501DRAFT_283362 [Backusella circina FSU 941]